MARSRHGFTLIELLIVVVIIGILAAIAIPKFQNTKGKAHWAAMRSDLHNLANAEESYYYSHNTYSTDLNALDLHPSSGVDIQVLAADSSGWSAKSTHQAAYPHLCAMFMGTASPVTPATTEGVVACQ